MSQALIASDNVNRLIKFLEGHAGRDKVVRLLQYASRFTGWWLINNNNAEWGKRFQSVESTSSLARKYFRLLKSISHLQTALRSYAQETDSIVKFTTVIQNLCLAMWLYYDHIILAAKVGIVKMDVSVQTRRSNTVWLLAMIAGIFKSLYLLQITQQLVKSTQKQETLESLRKRQTEYILEFFRNSFDVPIPLTNLNKAVSDAIPTGIVGICGTISSLIGVYQVWSKTTK